MTGTKAATTQKRREQAHPKRGEADPEQSRRFIEAARELGCEENLGRFDEAVKRIGEARRPPQPTKTARKKNKPG